MASACLHTGALVPFPYYMFDSLISSTIPSSAEPEVTSNTARWSPETKLNKTKEIPWR